MKHIFVIMILLLVVSACSGESSDKNSGNNLQETVERDVSLIYEKGETLSERINTPKGYERVDAADGSMKQFLRNYKMKDDGESVLIYNGSEKGNQNAHIAIFELPIENENLQQCADSVMRVYAEYYWSRGEYDKIKFYLTDGFLCEYSKWRDGYRVNFDGGTRWVKSASYDASYECFLKYMRIVFSYAGTASMQNYEAETISLSEVDVGDVILKGGSPGHVVMIVDVCENTNGEKAYLLAQGYMPAQEFHVIKNPLHEDDPWYYEKEMTFPLKTAEYTFDNETMIKRLKY